MRELREEREIYKIMSDVEKVNKEILFTMSHITKTMGHLMKLSTADLQQIKILFF